MGMVSRIFGGGRNVNQTARVEPRVTAPVAQGQTRHPSEGGDWSGFFGYSGGQTFGEPVSEYTAMAVSAVYRCVSLLSGLIAGLPLRVYRDDPKLGRQIVEPDQRDSVHGASMPYLARLLGQAPYPGRPLTSFAWRELWGVNTYLWGNHYSVKRYNGAGRLLGFEAAYPWAVEVRRNIVTGRNIYIVTWLDGTRETLDQDDVIHIMGPGFDGIRAPSRIQSFARNSVALSALLQEQTGRVHENAAKPTGAVTVSSNIKPEGFRRMQAFFNEQYSGRANAGKVLFLDADQKYTQMQMSPEDLATLETQRFTISDICRFYGVPPHLVGEAAGTSAWGSGIEQLTIGFLKYTLDADLQRIEHELNYKLLDGTPYYCWFDRDALAAMDAKTMAEILSIKINSGQMTPGEARRKSFLPAKPGDDQLFVNSTLRPIDAPYVPAAPKPADPPKEPAQ